MTMRTGLRVLVSVTAAVALTAASAVAVGLAALGARRVRRRVRQ